MTTEEAIKYVQQLYPHGGCCWLDEQRIEAIGIAVRALAKMQLPTNLDEAAEKHMNDTAFDNELDKIQCIKDFQAGAEWMIRQGFEAHCFESFNPVSESVDDKPLHGIGIIYEQNKNIPYVLAGDNIIIQIRKKED